MAASRPVLLAPVDLGLGRVEIEVDRLAGVTPELAVKLLAHARLGTLDRTDVTAPVAARELTRRRRRRRTGDRAQRRARAVSTNVLEIVEALRPSDLALRQRDRERARAQAAAPALHRPRRAHHTELRVDQLDQPRAARQLPDDRQPRIRRQVRIISADQQPSGGAVIVTRVHPQGDAPSPSVSFFTPRNLTVEADGKPRVCGAFPSPVPITPPPAATGQPPNPPI